MKINAISSRIICAPSKNLNFTRQMTSDEQKDYTQAIHEAQKYLGIQNQALIMHAASFPVSEESRNKSIDFCIGTPYAGKNVSDFLKIHGFNAIQLGPMGLLNRGDNYSPYTSSIYLKNPIYINLEALQETKYASILSPQDIYYECVNLNTDKQNYDRVSYPVAESISENLLEVAYDNFCNLLNDGDEDAEALFDEFDEYKKQEGELLDYYAVLDVLGDENGTDYYPYWSQEDANLIPRVKSGDEAAIERYEKIQDDNEYAIDLFKFKQFLINKQSNEYKASNQIPLIADLEVGVSSFDEIVFKDAFSNDYKLGCKYGGPFNSPQTWGFPLADPDKLFNPDGSLGEAGKYIKTKLECALKDSDGIRIDHIMGLVNPYIYKPETVQYGIQKDENGREVQYVLRDKLQSGYLSEIDSAKSEKYQRILPEIVLPVLRENGINPDKIVFENLGHDETGTFYKIFNDKEHLNGISCLIWTKGQDVPRDNWTYVGGHDNKPARMMVESHENDSEPSWSSDYLADRLRPYDYREREKLKQKIDNSQKEFLNAKYADLFRSSKNIQISFMDFFGINKPYNVPGTVGDENWTLRAQGEFDKKYYDTLSKQNLQNPYFDTDFAMNLPEILQSAVQSKAQEEVINGEPPEKVKRQTSHLMKELKRFENILKE